MPTPKGGKSWNAGTGKGWTDQRGYRWLYVMRFGRRVARREHRVVMEQHLGRNLEPWEVVHHKDENPGNNDLSNLEIVEFGAHSAEHARGRRANAHARRSMEAFALMREELRRERTEKAALLEALQNLMGLYDTPVERRRKASDPFYAEAVSTALSAIHAATGEK
jgi:hypothetical protein